LDEIEAVVPRELDVHLVMDNYATHKTPLIRRWLAKRPRWHVHLTPTRSSWLNQRGAGCPTSRAAVAAFRLGAAAITLIFSFLGFLTCRLPLCWAFATSKSLEDGHQVKGCNI